MSCWQQDSARKGLVSGGFTSSEHDTLIQAQNMAKFRIYRAVYPLSFTPLKRGYIILHIYIYMCVYYVFEYFAWNYSNFQSYGLTRQHLSRPVNKAPSCAGCFTSIMLSESGNCFSLFFFGKSCRPGLAVV